VIGGTRVTSTVIVELVNSEGWDGPKEKTWKSSGIVAEAFEKVGGGN